MMKTKWLWAAVLCAAAGLAQAQPASRASVEKLFEVQDFDKMIDDTFATLPASVLNSRQMQENLAAVPPEKRETVKQIISGYLAKDVQQFNTPEKRRQIRQVAVEGTQKVYTQKEVDALVKFYSTPEGRSIMAKMPQYMEATMTPMINVMQAEMMKSQQQNRIDMQREINRAVCGKNTCPMPPKTEYKRAK